MAARRWRQPRRQGKEEKVAAVAKAVRRRWCRWRRRRPQEGGGSRECSEEKEAVVVRRVARCSSRCGAWLGSAAWAGSSSACRRSISISIHVSLSTSSYLYLYPCLYSICLSVYLSYLSIRRGSCTLSASSGSSLSYMTRSSRDSASPPLATETREIPLPPELAPVHWLLRGDGIASAPTVHNHRSVRTS